VRISWLVTRKIRFLHSSECLQTRGLKLRDIDSAAGSSSAPDGDRKLWSNVWKGNVPPKVNVFT
jgi:hypothetical protein